MNITAIVKAISLISSSVPVISGFITQVETLLPEVAGSAKFLAVEAAAKAYFTKIEKDVEVLAHILPKIGGLIEGLVSMFNASGLFAKSAAKVDRVAAEVVANVDAVAAVLHP